MPSISRSMRHSALLLALAAPVAFGQNLTCGTALAQLQGYANQVNNVANMEFHQGIPMKCGMNLQCRQMLFQNLNAWYAQQASQVNGWYGQLVQQCAQSDSSAGRRVKSKRQSQNEPGEIDVDSIESLTMDDDDKTIRIKIPSNPRGFR